MKHLLAAAVLLGALLLACGEPSEATPTPTPPPGNDWRRCASLTCTYKVKWTGDVQTTFTGARISLATAETLEGTWEVD